MRKEKMKSKQRAVDNAILADQIVNGVAILLSSDNDPIERKNIWDYYPDLFVKEKEFAAKQKEITEIERFKEKRRKFANDHNSRMRGDD